MAGETDRTQKVKIDGKLYVRVKSGDTWGAWREVDQKTFNDTKADDSYHQEGDFGTWTTERRKH